MSLVTRLAVALVLCASPALADTRTDDPDDVDLTADDWLRIGLERYDREDWGGAIDAFERGHAIEPRPMIVFAIAQAHRRKGDCARARAYFDAFLAGNPGPQQAAAARDQRERCVDAAAAAPAPAAPAPVAAAPTATTPARRAEGPSRWTDPIVLAGGGATLAFAGTGVGFLVAAGRAADAAGAATTYDRHELLRERAERRQLYATIAFAGAGAAAAVTAVRLWRLGGRGETSGARTSWIPTAGPDTIGVAAVGSF